MAHVELQSRQAAFQLPPLTPEYRAFNQGSSLIAVDATLCALATITIFMRVYVRVFMLKMLGVDDYLMLVAGALSVSCLGLFIACVKLGIGRHIFMVPIENVAMLFKLLYFYANLVIFSYGSIKLSIGFFLLRLADRTKWRRTLQWMTAFVTLFTLLSTSAIIFQCIPVKAGYELALRPPIGTAKCYPMTIFRNIGVANSSINIGTDLFFALVPIPIIWKLQVEKRTRIGLVTVMGLGLVASGFAIYKVPIQYNYFNEMDWTGKGSWYYIWQQCEMNIGIIAANLPTIKPLFVIFSSKIRNLTSGSRSKASSHSHSAISTPFKTSGYLKHSEASQDDHHTSTFTINGMDNMPDHSYGAKSWFEEAPTLETTPEKVDESPPQNVRRESLGQSNQANRYIVRTTEFVIS